MILALETSCDDTCAALVARDGTVAANVVAAQEDHDRFGGVVPEVASRRHLELLPGVVGAALEDAGATLDDVELVAVTQGPGLVGALLVGVAAAKAIAAARELPLVGIDHLQGHVAATFLGVDALEPPFLCLVASGGHTFLAEVRDHTSFAVLGASRDDAAGEALDKGARMLGGPFPGGAWLSQRARDGDPAAFAFPRAHGVTGLDFSYAGLKTALLYALRELGDDPPVADLAASYEAAVVDQLVVRVRRALEQTGLRRVSIGGGVAANRLLRERIAALGAEVHTPAPELCTDNAAMIGSAARFVTPPPLDVALAMDAYSTSDRGIG